MKPAMNIVKIHNEVPFASSMCYWLRLYEMGLPKLEKNSHRYDSHYLAWQSVRKKRNPYFSNGTGFEGYFVGDCQSPGAALEQLLAVGHEILDNITTLHRYEYNYRSNLMKTLMGEGCNFKAVYEWNAILGATLARLRCRVLNDREAVLFRKETYRLVNQLPEINYQRDPGTVEQEYYIVPDLSHQKGKLTVSNTWLKPSDVDAWLVLNAVGKFGHPLVRNYLKSEIQAHGHHAA
jgi:hypothetical protein